MTMSTPTLQQLADIEAIKVLKHRYFRAMDTADMSMLETLFAEDLTVDYRGSGYRVQINGKADMMTFLANSFHSGAVAMHHGNMPEITITGEDTAEGIWYLFDIFINSEVGSQTIGSAIYKDRYRRENGEWIIAHTEYDRIIELNSKVGQETVISAQYLANVGLRPEQRQDISRLISWGN